MPILLHVSALQGTPEAARHGLLRFLFLQQYALSFFPSPKRQEERRSTLSPSTKPVLPFEALQGPQALYGSSIEGLGVNEVEGSFYTLSKACLAYRTTRVVSEESDQGKSAPL